MTADAKAIKAAETLRRYCSERGCSGYSYSPAPENQVVPFVETYEKYIDFQKSTDFSRLIDGKDASKVWEVIDELMQTLKLIMPQLYDGTMQKIRAKTQ